MFFYDLDKLEKEQIILEKESVKEVVLNIDNCDYRVEFRLSKSGKTVSIIDIHNDNYDFECKYDYVIINSFNDEYIFPHQTIKGKVLRKLILDNYMQ